MVHAAVFSRNGKLVLTCGKDGTARLWGGATGKPLGLSVYRRGAAYSATFSPDGREIVIGRYKLIQFVEVPTPMTGTLEEIRRRIEAATGLSAAEKSPL